MTIPLSHSFGVRLDTIIILLIKFLYIFMQIKI